MDDKQEKLRAGIALLQGAELLLEQAGVEFGGAADNTVDRLKSEAIHAVQQAMVRAVRQYDRAKVTA